MSNIPLIDLYPANELIRTSVRKEMAEIVGSSQFIGGEAVKKLEHLFCSKGRDTKALSVNSGTDALYIGFKTIQRIMKWDPCIVVVPSFTYNATADAAVRAVGAGNVVLADVSRKTFMLETQSVLDAVQKAILVNSANGVRVDEHGGFIICPVHLYGGVCTNLTSLRKRLREEFPDQKFSILEDCAQSQGSVGRAKGLSRDESEVGSAGDASAYSFFPTKNFGAWGDGGMLTFQRNMTFEVDVAWREAWALAHHGCYPENKYLSYTIGTNSRMDALQAVVVRQKMEVGRYDYPSGRRRVYETYKRVLEEMGLPVRIVTCAGAYHSHKAHPSLMIIEFEQERVRGEVYVKFKLQELNQAIYYQTPLHLQPAFAECLRSDVMSGSLSASQQSLALPFYYGMADEQVTEVCKNLRRAIENAY